MIFYNQGLQSTFQFHIYHKDKSSEGLVFFCSCCNLLYDIFISNCEICSRVVYCKSHRMNRKELNNRRYLHFCHNSMEPYVFSCMEDMLPGGSSFHIYDDGNSIFSNISYRIEKPVFLRCI